MAGQETQASSRIFISYRREDSIAHVNALFHPLRERFGPDRLFKDTDSIAPGQDFLKAIKSQLDLCSVFLAVIGSKWLTAQKPKANIRRLDDPTDYLRVEVATALKNEKVRVIPILVGQASMPAPEDLPPDLANLAFRNGFELRDSRWDSDVKLLIQAIERACGEPAAASPKPPSGPPPEPPPLAPPGGGASRSSHDGEEFDLLEVRRKRQIAEHVKVAREAFEAQDYEAVLEACEKSIWLDPQQGEARDLARRARRELDGKKIQGWLTQAKELLARKELTDAELASASELIDQALALDNTHEAAVRLRQEVLAIRKQRERQREVDRHVRAALTRAHASFDEEDFDAAIEHCDDALAVSPESAEALLLRFKAAAAKEEERRQRELKRRAQQVVKDARAEFAAGEQEAALARLAQFSPPHELVARALEELQEELQALREAREQKEREARAQALIAQARSLMTSERFGDAAAKLHEAVGLSVHSSEVAALLQEIEVAEAAAEARVRSALAADEKISASDEMFRQRDYSRARELLEAARSLRADHPGLTSRTRRIDEALVTQEQRTQAIRASMQQAEASFDRGDFESTIHAAEQALGLDASLGDAQILKDRAIAALKEERETQARRREVSERAAAEAETVRLEAIAEQKRVADARERELKAAAEAKAIAERERRAAIEAEAKAQAKTREREEAKAREREEAKARERDERDRQRQQQLARDREELERQQAIFAATAAVTAHIDRGDLARAEQALAESAHLLSGTAAEALQRRIAVLRKPGPVEQPAARPSEDKTPWSGPSLPVSTPPRTLYIAGGALLLALVAGGIWLVSPGNTPSDDTGPQVSDEVSPGNPDPGPPPPDVPPSVAGGQVPGPADPVPPRESGPGASQTPPGKPQIDVAQVRRLEELRATARRQLQLDRAPQALDASVEGLKIDAKDPALLGIVAGLLRDAQAASNRAKQDAGNAGRGSPVVVEFNQGIQKEAEAAKRHDTGQDEAAIRALWAAADDFTKAAGQSRQLAAEAAEQARQKLADEQAQAERERNERELKEAADRKNIRVPETPAQRDEEPSIREVLRRYEAAYASLNVDAVRNVFPSVPAGQLGQSFRDLSSYTLSVEIQRIDISADRRSANVLARVTHELRAKSGSRNRPPARTQTFTLENRDNGWLIVQVR